MMGGHPDGGRTETVRDARGTSKFDVPYLVCWMTRHDMYSCQLRYSIPNLRLESANSLFGNTSNSMHLFWRGALRNCDNDIVLCHFHSRLLWAVIADWFWRRLDRLFAKAGDSELIPALYVQVTIRFRFLAFVFALIGEYELGKIPEELAPVFADLAHDKSRPPLGRDRADVREYSADCCRFILIYFVHVTISCC